MEILKYLHKTAEEKIWIPKTMSHSCPGSQRRQAWFVSLSDLAVLSDTDIWALGGATKSSKGADVLYHWDGSAWSSPAGVAGVAIKSSSSGFVTSPAGQPWLIGSTDKNQPLIERWNGQAWSQLALPTPVYGFVDSLAVSGLRAWVLVDEYDAKDVSKANANSSLTTMDQVLETNCKA